MEKEEYEKELAKAKEIARELKRNLKMRSKSQLIEIIIAYASDLTEMQAVARQLLEENKELKGESNEKTNTEIDS